jgi:transcription antitermination protein NusB
MAGRVSSNSRRQARERALSLLYECEAKELSAADVLAELPTTPDKFAVELVNGVDEHRDQLDELIQRYSQSWAIDRMPSIDRNLLRMGIYELLHRPDVPTGAAISEAVELAARYSTEESGRFVNGLLGRIAEEVRPAT